MDLPGGLLSRVTNFFSSYSTKQTISSTTSGDEEHREPKPTPSSGSSGSPLDQLVMAQEADGSWSLDSVRHLHRSSVTVPSHLRSVEVTPHLAFVQKRPQGVSVVLTTISRRKPPIGSGVPSLRSPSSSYASPTSATSGPSSHRKAGVGSSERALPWRSLRPPSSTSPERLSKNANSNVEGNPLGDWVRGCFVTALPGSGLNQSSISGRM